MWKGIGIINICQDTVLGGAVFITIIYPDTCNIQNEYC